MNRIQRRLLRLLLLLNLLKLLITVVRRLLVLIRRWDDLHRLRRRHQIRHLSHHLSSRLHLLHLHLLHAQMTVAIHLRSMCRPLLVLLVLWRHRNSRAQRRQRIIWHRRKSLLSIAGLVVVHPWCSITARHHHLLECLQRIRNGTR